MALARRLRPCGFHQAPALALRRRERHQALQLLAAAGRADGCLGESDQQVDIPGTFRAMKTIKRCSRLTFGSPGTAPFSGLPTQSLTEHTHSPIVRSMRDRR